MSETQFAGSAPKQEDAQASGVGTPSLLGVSPFILATVALSATAGLYFFWTGEVMLLALAVWLLAAGALATWVYFDAKRQGLSGAWALVAGLLLVLGVALYLVVRELRPCIAVK